MNSIELFKTLDGFLSPALIAATAYWLHRRQERAKAEHTEALARLTGADAEKTAQQTLSGFADEWRKHYERCEKELEIEKEARKVLRRDHDKMRDEIQRLHRRIIMLENALDAKNEG